MKTRITLIILAIILLAPLIKKRVDQKNCDAHLESMITVFVDDYLFRYNTCARLGIDKCYEELNKWSKTERQAIKDKQSECAGLKQ